MSEYDENELKNILKEHEKWLCKLGGRQADFRWANLEGTNLEGANLKWANLEGANLKWANLEGVNLEGVNLEGACLKGACLEGACLKGANLRGANLRGANLRGACLKGANLDFSAMNFSSKDLGHYIDDRLAIQRLYHTLYNINYSKYVSQDIKNALLIPEILEIANRFHRVGEWGQIVKKESEGEE